MGVGQRIKREWADAKEAGVELVAYLKVRRQKRKEKGWNMRKNWWKWLILIICIVCTILLSVYHKKVVALFEPHKQKIVDLPASWLIPIGILIIISFPPLAGHEIILLAVGLIWGLWVGFGIASAGTFIGELLCFWAFKYFLTDYGKKIEEKHLMYACLARLMREGGLGIIVLVRFSVLPGHITTAVQSTVGMPLWIYCVAVIISLPKQLVVVYLGVLFGSTGEQAATERKISLSVFFLTALMTIIAGYVVYMRARKLYPAVAAEAEARRATKLSEEERAAARIYGHGAGTADLAGDSTTEIPLTSNAARMGSKWQDPFADRQPTSYPDVEPYPRRPSREGYGATGYTESGYAYGNPSQVSLTTPSQGEQQPPPPDYASYRGGGEQDQRFEYHVREGDDRFAPVRDASGDDGFRGQQRR